MYGFLIIEIKTSFNKELNAFSVLLLSSAATSHIPQLHEIKSSLNSYISEVSAHSTSPSRLWRQQLNIPLITVFPLKSISMQCSSCNQIQICPFSPLLKALTKLTPLPSPAVVVSKKTDAKRSALYRFEPHETHSLYKCC